MQLSLLSFLIPISRKRYIQSQLMSKQELIKVIEIQIKKPECYLFRTYIEQLTKEVDRNHALLGTLNVLLNETCCSVREKKIALEGKYSKKMKILTILSCFFGCTTYSLPKLSQELGVSLQETQDLLVEASIFKLITVKIDEFKGIISISNSKVREREAGENPQKYLKGKLIQIKERNSKLQRQIKGLVKQIGGGGEERQQEKKGSLLSQMQQMKWR